jgi:B12-binding domain/radical SAM domain protein of rhizo-twelve system
MRGHEVQVVDGQMDNLNYAQIRKRVEEFQPDFTVVTTAPSYLFWRCAPPELRIPQETAGALRDIGGKLVIVGPHASTTPRATLLKLDADVAVIGECEEILPQLVNEWPAVASICFRTPGAIRVNGKPHASDMTALPALKWESDTIARHHHHHHRFEAPPTGPGAEMETSRGCPYHCTFCAKDNFRSAFRRRPVEVIGRELTGLTAQGVEYVYFIDEIFLPHIATLEVIRQHRIKFGVQTRIDLWTEPMLDLLGAAGCVSIEAGVESITEQGRDELDKKCKLSTDEITQRLIHAKQRVPFVQANLMDSRYDDPARVTAWRERLQEQGVWSNQPVPMFPYPGSPDYTRRWGAADDRAWERAHDAYLSQFQQFSDIQESRPAPLQELELVVIENIPPQRGRDV